MSRIKTISPEDASGIPRLLMSLQKRKSGGYIPGIMKVLLVDLKVGFVSNIIYNHLHMRDDSPLTRLQREMIATVVNGKIGGMP